MGSIPHHAWHLVSIQHVGTYYYDGGLCKSPEEQTCRETQSVLALHYLTPPFPSLAVCLGGTLLTDGQGGEWGRDPELRPRMVEEGGHIPAHPSLPDTTTAISFFSSLTCFHGCHPDCL